MRRKRLPRAFTLIELLVVVAILALLIAMLLPSLAMARSVARYAVCKAHMKQTGTAWMGFVETHGGRFPGGAAGQYDYWYVCWPQILNREWFHGNDPAYYPKDPGGYGDEPTCGPLVKFWSFWSPDYKLSDLHRKYMTCSEYKAWRGSSSSNVWSRPWIANDHTVAGHYFDPSDTSWCDPASPTNPFFQDGVLVPDSKAPNPAYLSTSPRSWGGKNFYALGRRVESWASPSSKYLMWEAEAWNDMDRYNPGEGAAASLKNGTLKLNDNANFPPWAAQGGEQAFRHMLGPDSAMWQKQARAPVLFVDGHVIEWNPNSPQYLSQNFDPTK